MTPLFFLPSTQACENKERKKMHFKSMKGKSYHFTRLNNTKVVRELQWKSKIYLFDY